MTDPIPPDSPDGYEADLAAMRHDASGWVEASNRLGSAASIAQGLQLDEARFSIIGSQVGLVAAYADFRGWVVGLLNDGKSNFADLSDVLKKVAEIYEDKDNSAADHVNQINPEGG